MPEPNSQFYERLGATRKASTAYGDEFLVDNSPINIPDQQFPTPELGHMRYSPTPTPAVQTNLLDVEENQVQELVFLIRRLSLSIPYCQSLANRLVTLFNDAKEEDCVCPGIAVGSLRNFYIFLQSHTDLKCPTISLTPEYNIYASWRAEPNRVFSVHFLPSGDARFVIFKPNDKHPERQIRLSGIATTDILIETVAPYGVLDWISESGTCLRAA